jgi:hypothetical protein
MCLLALSIFLNGIVHLQKMMRHSKFGGKQRLDESKLLDVLQNLQIIWNLPNKFAL